MGLTRTVSAVFGVVYVLVGVVGFVMETPLFGLFDVSVAHNVVHLALGAILLWGAMSTSSAIMATRVVGVILLVVGVLGFLDPFPDVLPLGGYDIWLHLASGVILAAVGFMGTSEPATV